VQIKVIISDAVIHAKKSSTSEEREKGLLQAQQLAKGNFNITAAWQMGAIETKRVGHCHGLRLNSQGELEPELHPDPRH
jgi:hypothetical protein